MNLVYQRIAPAALLLIGLLALLTVLSEPAATQVLYGSVVGTVEDQTGAVVPGAAVSIKSAQTGAARATVTDGQGRYSISNVVPGRYDLTVVATGFRPLTRTKIEVTINTVTRENPRLEVGTIAETINVQASAVQLQTDKSDVRSEISATAVTNLPLPNYRNYQSLINLVPGATPATFQNAVVDTPARALTTNINGTARNNNNTLVDGAVNTFIWLPHHTLYVQPVESIETVNVTTGSFDAEQGMAGGAAITVATKSGTNQIHGSGFWFHGNQHLNSAAFRKSETYRKPVEIIQSGRRDYRGSHKARQAVLLFQFRKNMGAERSVRKLLRRPRRMAGWRFQRLEGLRDYL